jgi:phage terminase large subunit-like protein
MRSAWAAAADLLDPPDDNWNPLPHQLPPMGDWFVWLLLGGRGAGKTAASARYVHEHVHGPPCLPGVPGGHWIGIVAPTLGDAVTSCVYGPSGLRAHDPGVKVTQAVGGAMVRWSNGTEAKLFGAHSPQDVERFRSGGNRCLVWGEELAAWRYMNQAWEQIRYGLRVGPRPHAIVSTTPRNRELLKKLIKDPTTAITKAITSENPHLDENVKRRLFEDYGDTRMGRQELYAEILEDIEGALWTAAMIDDHRIKLQELPKHLDQIVVGVDPAAKDAENSDETGIIVVGYVNRWEGLITPDTRSHGFVLGDYSVKGKPDVWAKAVLRAYDDYGANKVVVEINNGGDMIKHTLRGYRPTLPVKEEHASRGKVQRAEPVSVLYEQGRVHHVGSFPKLEDQMTTYDVIDPDDSWSPDHMDAMVWAFTNLMVTPGLTRTSTVQDRRLRKRR